MQVKSKVWLEQDGQLCFGTGRAQILRAVEACGSLNAAARQLGLSYRHVWSQVRSAENGLGQALLVRHRGGRGRGGAELTPFARDLLQRFEKLEVRNRRAADRAYAQCFACQSKASG